MKQTLTELVVETTGRRLYEITSDVLRWVADQRVEQGSLTLFVRHTSASLTIQENADPEVQRDLERFLDRLVPQGDPLFRHTMEGPDDMPAHVRSLLTDVSLTIPVMGGRPVLGQWQGIYLYEHRTAPHRRRVVAQLLG